MVFYLAEWLRSYVSGFNVVRYVSFRTMASFVTSLIICLALYPWFIRRLESNAVTQHVRECGPKTHLSKEGTPTMGGALVMFAILASGVLWTQLDNVLVQCTLCIGLCFGVVGLLDDIAKLRQRSSKGIPGRWRLLAEFGFTLVILGIFLVLNRAEVRYDLNLYIPFVSVEKFWISLPLLAYLVFGAFVIVGAANAVNLTDGLDGLAAGPVITSAGTFTILAYITGAKLGSFDLSKYLLVPKVLGAQELAIVCSAIMGATIGFLYYNTYPAEIFMGDTGALGLGGLLGSVAVLTKNELLSAIVLGIFLFEAVSVIVQTTWFKLTGRRVFPMAPIHHTFELRLKWPEPKIVVRFWIVSILLAMVALASIKVR